MGSEKSRAVCHGVNIALSGEDYRVHKVKTCSMFRPKTQLCTKAGNKQGSVSPGTARSLSVDVGEQGFSATSLRLISKSSFSGFRSPGTKQIPRRLRTASGRLPTIRGPPAAQFSRIPPALPRRSRTVQPSLHLTRAGCTDQAAGPRSPSDPETLGPVPCSADRRH